MKKELCIHLYHIFLKIKIKSDFDKDLDTTSIKSELKSLILRFAKGPEKNSVSLNLDKSR